MRKPGRYTILVTGTIGTMVAATGIALAAWVTESETASGTVRAAVMPGGTVPVATIAPGPATGVSAVAVRWLAVGE